MQTEIEILTADEKALETAISIVNASRVMCNGESDFAWNKLWRVGEYLGGRRKVVQKGLADYFSEPTEGE
jgi:hypothetical protein